MEPQPTSSCQRAPYLNRGRGSSSAVGGPCLGLCGTIQGGFIGRSKDSGDTAVSCIRTQVGVLNRLVPKTPNTIENVHQMKMLWRLRWSTTSLTAMELSTTGGHKGFRAQVRRSSRPLVWSFESTLATTASRSTVATGEPLEGRSRFRKG